MDLETMQFTNRSTFSSTDFAGSKILLVATVLLCYGDPEEIVDLIPKPGWEDALITSLTSGDDASGHVLLASMIKDDEKEMNTEGSSLLHSRCCEIEHWARLFDK
ncbi:hypothetical protein HO133_000566 [Letharia lupina]|uniref:Uncharacterized protein n=1 Tax=Letharia lupina TaxID=560253 RepID=A0A8H6CHN9_9LECA|nr:uncharacterized protein HO133_000566 [Letharia lupina]KAF6223723.1 hypothetical protein HO133_000566 [Letharia lupina]